LNAVPPVSGKRVGVRVAVLQRGCLLLLLAGCAGPVDLSDPTTLTSDAPSSYSDRDWATVLRENVKNGLVDYDHLAAHAEPLRQYLAMVARFGPQTAPESFGSQWSRLGYCLNAYNAGVLAAVLHARVPATMHEVGGPSLESGYRLLIDGQPLPLGDLRSAAWAESGGDARVEFCLCDAAKGSPPLQSQPFRAESIEQDLRRVAREAMDSSSMVSVDHENERLLMGLVIWHRRAQFLDLHRRLTGTRSPTLLSALLHMAGGVRREWLNTAVGYRVGVIPFDRSLNRWTATASD